MTITKGLATWLGMIGAAAGVLIPFIADLSDVAEPLNVPADVWVKCSAALAIAVIVGRMAQAVAMTIRPPVVDETLLPEDPPSVPTDVS